MNLEWHLVQALILISIKQDRLSKKELIIITLNVEILQDDLLLLYAEYLSSSNIHFLNQLDTFFHFLRSYLET